MRVISKIDVKNLRESCLRRSTRLGVLAQYNALNKRHIINVTVDDPIRALLGIASIWSICVSDSK